MKNMRKFITLIQQLAVSVLSALFGIRSEAGRKDDFSKQLPIHYYVMAGLVASVSFIVIVLLWVSVMING